MGVRVVFTKQLAAASANNIATSQTPGSAALTLNGAAVSGGVATIDTTTSTNLAIGQRVIVTSGGNDTGINWTVVGTNSTGNPITDVFAGVSGGAAQSNYDFVTVSSITPSGAVASTALAGTNGLGSSPWVAWDYRTPSPLNIGFAVELVSGSVNFTVQHTYDNPNGLSNGSLFPLPFNSPTATGVASTIDGAYSAPIVATRLLINSGTGQVRVRFMQTGIS